MVKVMVECFEERLKKARRCVVDQANKYVIALNHGEATEQMLNTMMLTEGYIDALERYNPDPIVCLSQGYLKIEGAFLTIGSKALYLSKPVKTVKINPDAYNCLSQMDVEHIFEQISTLCGGCSCNCA